MPLKVKLYLVLIAALASASIIINVVTEYQFKWWNLLGLTVTMLLSRFIFDQSLTIEEKQWIKGSNKMTGLSWVLLLITICILISALAN